MTDQYWTFGGGPAERIENRDGVFEQWVPIYITSSVTGRMAEPDMLDSELQTGPNGRIPQFRLPREWEWSSVSVSVDGETQYPLGQARELQQRPATVLRLQDLVTAQDEQISTQWVVLKVQEAQIGTLLSQVAAASAGTGLPDQVDPDSPDLPEPSDPETGEDGGNLPLPGELPLPGDLPDLTTPDSDGSSLPLPEGFKP